MAIGGSGPTGLWGGDGTWAGSGRGTKGARLRGKAQRSVPVDGKSGWSAGNMARSHLAGLLSKVDKAVAARQERPQRGHHIPFLRGTGAWIMILGMPSPSLCMTSPCSVPRFPHLRG